MNNNLKIIFKKFEESTQISKKAKILTNIIYKSYYINVHYLINYYANILKTIKNCFNYLMEV